MEGHLAYYEGVLNVVSSSGEILVTKDSAITCQISQHVSQQLEGGIKMLKLEGGCVYRDILETLSVCHLHATPPLQPF